MQCNSFSKPCEITLPSAHLNCMLRCFFILRNIIRPIIACFPESPRKLISPHKRKTVAVSWTKNKEIALVQYIALLILATQSRVSGQHLVYWAKAAAFIHQVKSELFFQNRKASCENISKGKMQHLKLYCLYFFSFLHYSVFLSFFFFYRCLPTTIVQRFVWSMQPQELFLKKYNYYVYLCSLQIIRNVIMARQHQDESLAL